MNMFFKNLLIKIAEFPGISQIREYIFKNNLIILLYHEINPMLFENHIKYLIKKYSIIPLRELLKRRNLKNKLIITFDDGFSSNYELLPIFRKHNLPITIFLPFNWIGHKKILTLKEIWGMKTIVDFQSHSMNHIDLTTCTNNQLKHELSESKNKLSALIKKDIYAIAYPFNRANQREIKSAIDAGYQIGRIGNRRLNRLNGNFMTLYSIGIEKNDTVKDLQNKIVWSHLKTIFHSIPSAPICEKGEEK